MPIYRASEIQYKATLSDIMTQVIQYSSPNINRK